MRGTDPDAFVRTRLAEDPRRWTVLPYRVFLITEELITVLQRRDGWAATPSVTAALDAAHRVLRRTRLPRYALAREYAQACAEVGVQLDPDPWDKLVGSRDWARPALTPQDGCRIGLANGPSDETRAAACRDAYWAFRYARDVDRAPHDDTRAAASADPHWAYGYALDVDRAPHDDTRAAASADPHWADLYTQYVDNS